MKLWNTKTGDFEEAEIAKLDKEDYIWIKNTNQFRFNWKAEENNNVYKIYRTQMKEEILGLLSLRDVEEELRIQIELIEISYYNIGKEKMYDRIAGCLIGFACQLAFEKSYDGFVSLLPKTALIKHYCEKYGFRQYGRHLALDYQEALSLIKKYLRNE